eukprot:TRINITY_DN7963_c0_g2_i1.p1 TRINITY_DN7963_c0_g2~~TRINITY_DN7963_c0_g2_i1.p1  ORF type:complete len:112 (-),score=2.02 TRINITY_DN7963_c0_g2_i1:498-833(-)
MLKKCRKNIPVCTYVCSKLLAGFCNICCETILITILLIILLNETLNYEQWPDFGCEGIKVQRAHQPTSQCQVKSFYSLYLNDYLMTIQLLGSLMGMKITTIFVMQQLGVKN